MKLLGMGAPAAILAPKLLAGAAPRTPSPRKSVRAVMFNRIDILKLDGWFVASPKPLDLLEQSQLGLGAR